MSFCQILSILLNKSFNPRLGFGFLLSKNPNSCQEVKLLAPKCAKECCNVGTLEASHLWSLATSVKAQRLTSRSLPIKLHLFYLMTNQPSVKTPLDVFEEVN